MIVVDASALTDFLLGRGPAMAAIAEAMHGREEQPLHAPELVEPEILNALRGLARGGKVSDRRATEAVGDFGNLRMVRYPQWPLRPRVWELRNALTAYDATYLALAEALDAQVLLTADRGLAAAAAESLGAERARHIG